MKAKVKDIILQTDEYEGHTYESAYLLLDNNKKIRIGTIKQNKDGSLYLVCATKKKYKEN